jgi:hypothetical protein
MKCGGLSQAQVIIDRTAFHEGGAGNGKSAQPGQRFAQFAQAAGQPGPVALLLVQGDALPDQAFGLVRVALIQDHPAQGDERVGHAPTIL